MSAADTPAGLDPWQVKLEDWFRLKARIAAECQPLVEQERAMRAELFAHYFPEPKEGTNNATLPDGYVLKGTYPIERKVDPAIVTTLRGLRLRDLEPGMLAQLNMGGAPADMLVLEALRMNVDALLNWEPKLETKEYRKLTAEQAMVFDRCLTSKPGSISMTVAPPSTRAAAGTKAAAGFGTTATTQE